ncbi:TMV resistance protein N-like [Durio zibethinus]|uniref:TMV resistance protein N-like n=1 Tax=Durio zibethinus TaxID=66656 RepID=A0A6P5Y6H4_DURZI|nr:TMV resistance protein N-like [Durio zibethinus]
MQLETKPHLQLRKQLKAWSSIVKGTKAYIYIYISFNKVRIIYVQREQSKTFTLNADAFLKMKRLRLLRVSLPSSFQQENHVLRMLKVFHRLNSQDLKYISDELRLLDWSGYPFRSLPSSFQPDNLVALLLPNSHIEHLWKPLSKLKLVNLQGSKNLIKAPDCTTAPNLESLILEDCTRLVDVNLGVQSKPKLLNLRGCKSLRSLPNKIGMESLDKLILSGCSNLQRFPEIEGEMECLQELHLDGTGIEELPSSIGRLSHLVLLNLKNCNNLSSLPNSIDGCKCLKTLNLSGCSKVGTLLENLLQVEFLEELDLSETSIRIPPSFIFQFKNLKVLSFKGCKGPPSKLRSNFPSRFLARGSIDSMALMLPPLSGLSSLTKLNLSDCNLGDIPNDIACLSSLKELYLSGNNFICLPETLSRLSKLYLLELVDCRKLKSLPKRLPSVRCVYLDGCASPEEDADPIIECNLLFGRFGEFRGINCYKLAEKNNALTMLKKHIKVFVNVTRAFDIFNDSQWVGVALCCVFVNDEAYNFDDDKWKPSKDICHRMDGYYRKYGRTCYFLPMNRRQHAKKDHLWLTYMCRSQFYLDEVNEFESGIRNGIRNESYCKVKKYGLRLVYKKDLEEMEQIQEKHNSPASTGNGGALGKRKRDIYEKRAGLSEIDSAEERPPPKWPKKL